jgi:hypothetical protein
MHFMQKRVPDPLHPGKSLPLPVPELMLKGKMVQVKPSYKYLGIHLDSQLRWTTQAHEALAKATKWILLYCRLMRLSIGLSASFMRRLFITVAISKMTYGLDVWYTLPSRLVGRRKSLGSVKALRESSKLQRLATLVINRALRTAPTDILDTHAGLLPMNLLLKKICFRSLLHICALPPSSLVSDQVVSQIPCETSKVYRMNLQQLMKLFKVNPTVFEVVPVVSRPLVFQLL